MDILTQIDSARAKMWQHFLQSNLLLLWCVSAVINDNVDAFHTLPESAPKCSVRLIPNKDRGVVILIYPARFLDVYSVYMALLSKIGSPHPKASPAIDTDLQDIHLLTHKPRKMTVINFEIMLPFPDSVTVLMFLKIVPKWIHRRRERRLLPG
jgi:hypothetical protein